MKMMFGALVLALAAATACTPEPAPIDAVATASTPLPGNPSVSIEPNLDDEWVIVGMNNDWMFLVRPVDVLSFTGVTGRVRIEHTSPQIDADGTAYLSEDLLHEIRCSDGQWRLVGIQSFAGNNLSGDRVVEIENLRIADWETPPEGSIFQASLAEICRLHGKS